MISRISELQFLVLSSKFVDRSCRLTAAENNYELRTLNYELLLDNFRNRARAHGPTAFANREAQALLHGHRCNQFNL